MQDVNLSIQEIKQLDPNESFETIVLIRKLTTKTSRIGKLFLQVEAGDALDTFTFNCFENTQPFVFFQSVPEKFPQIVRIQGQIEYFADKLSPRIKQVESIEANRYEFWLGQLLEKPEEPFELLKDELYAFIDEIKHPKLAQTTRAVFEDLGDSFFNSVAAASMHHAYWHGLLEHSVHVTRVAKNLLPLYPQVNADLAIAGALLHDVGKTLEYRYESVEGIDRTLLGRLEGHVVLGYRLVRKAGLTKQLEPEWLERLEHIILSHQGEPEWGAAVYPATPEAVFVSLCDNLDAKMAMVQQQHRKALPTQVFSDFVPGLQSRLLTQALPE